MLRRKSGCGKSSSGSPGKYLQKGMALPAAARPVLPLGHSGALRSPCLSPRLMSCTPGDLVMSLGTRHPSHLTATLKLHGKQTPTCTARAPPAVFLCVQPVHKLIILFSFRLPSSRCWYRHGGEGAGNADGSSGAQSKGAGKFSHFPPLSRK